VAADDSRVILNPAPFFAVARKRLGRLSKSQVQGIERIVHPLLARWKDTRWTAYALATTEHEGGKTFQPIRERGPKSYFAKYEPGTKLGIELGNTEPGDGYLFRGGGDVMVTGRGHFRRFGELLDIDLEGHPELVTDPAVSLNIMKLGLERGLFTGRALADYFNGKKCDWRNARRCVNGLDKADVIAGYAQSWESAIRAGIVPATEI
jgi:putative chitinase